MNPVGLLIIAAGVFVLIAVAQDWDWFFNSRRAQLFVSLFGRGGARIFYGLLGIAFTIGGIFMTLFGRG